MSNLEWEKFTEKKESGVAGSEAPAGTGADETQFTHAAQPAAGRENMDETRFYEKDEEDAAQPAGPGIFMNIPAADYHAAARRGEWLGSSMLRLFMKSGAMYRAAMDNPPAASTTAQRLGRAVHVLALEGEEPYRQTYRIGGPVNPRTRRTYGHESEAWRAWLLGEGLDAEAALSPEEDKTVRRMAEAVRQHPEMQKFMRGGTAEQTARAVWEGEYCQARLDWTANDGTIVELKTTRRLEAFRQFAEKWQYAAQLAFYRDVVQAAGGGRRRCVLVVAEKEEPLRVAVWKMPEEDLAAAGEKNRAAVRRLQTARATGVWTTGYETALVWQGGTGGPPPRGAGSWGAAQAHWMN